jgi:undecaprenyl-diphosphatase
MEMTMTEAIARKPRRLSYALAIVTALLLLGFGLLADEVIEGDTVAFDRAVADIFREAGNATDPWGPIWVEEVGRDVTAMGSFTILGAVVIATVIYLAMSGKGRTAAFVTFSVIGGTIVSTGLKYLFDRPRPDVEAATRVFTASFPSGHATVSAVVYLTLGLLLGEAMRDRRLKLYFMGLGIFMTLMVGVSRVYLGVHYPTDVIAGWSIGGAWALACWAGYSVLFGRDRGGTAA